MIEFSRDPQNSIPSSNVKIIGLGGAGANMIDRVFLDGMDGAEMLALNSDIRTLNATSVRERIQLGRNLTKGLGTGGDPELGQKVMLEAENEVRAAIKGRKIIFLCVGLGGGTGSGGAPTLARIAREEGAFVVVFATMPFHFEGRRRRDQAETALNELAVLSNALVTFDNNRMGELVLANKGIHEAFSAGDRMISDSIKAVIRLVIRPGLIHVGLDDLMAALRTTRSRCLFGSGSANGKDRASKALANALASPLLDKGSLLRQASSVLVHICGGTDLTLHEVDLLMQKLMKHVPEQSHVLFGAAIDEKMDDHISITLISALPEDKLQEVASPMLELEPTVGYDFVEPVPVSAEPLPESAPEVAEIPQLSTTPASSPIPSQQDAAELQTASSQRANEVMDYDPNEPVHILEIEPEDSFATAPTQFAAPFTSSVANALPSMQEIDRWSAPLQKSTATAETSAPVSPFAESIVEKQHDKASLAATAANDLRDAIHPVAEASLTKQDFFANTELGDLMEKSRNRFSQEDELFQATSRGKFSDTEASIIDGEDFDIPPFMRKKKK